MSKIGAGDRRFYRNNNLRSRKARVGGGWGVVEKLGRQATARARFMQISPHAAIDFNEQAAANFKALLIKAKRKEKGGAPPARSLTSRRPLGAGGGRPRRVPTCGQQPLPLVGTEAPGRRRRPAHQPRRRRQRRRR